MCGFLSTRPAGSSTRACTASACACQATTGSGSALGSSTPAPEARKSGNQDVRWSTTERAVHPSTGAGTSQSRVPRTRSPNAAAMARWRSAGVSGNIGQHLVELGVPLVDARLHAAAQPHVPVLEAVDERLGVQPGAAVAEVLERQRLQRDAVGHALERERLDDPVRAHLVERAAEAVLLVAGGVHVLPAPAG